ncbi:hypothetical protein B0H14DRAFT_2605195 [Mycena olivaceomarginata]|nr:hypothetical protein B0H14DRAFT_2605195 [Mycena olivaceomarginata]
MQATPFTSSRLPPPYSPLTSTFLHRLALLARPQHHPRDPYYSKLDVSVEACIIHGTNGIDGLFSGKPKRPMAKTIEADAQDPLCNPWCNCQCCFLHIGDVLANDKAWAVCLTTGTMSCSPMSTSLAALMDRQELTSGSG